MEAVELQRRVNEHASDLLMSVWEWCSRGYGGFQSVLWCGGLKYGFEFNFLGFKFAGFVFCWSCFCWVLNLLFLGLVFISVFNFFYLVKINKLIFFNLEADVESHVDTVGIILMFLIFSVCQLCEFCLWCNGRDKNETRFPG